MYDFMLIFFLKIKKFRISPENGNKQQNTEFDNLKKKNDPKDTAVYNIIYHNLYFMYFMLKTNNKMNKYKPPPMLDNTTDQSGA